MSSKIGLVITSNGTADDFKSQCNLAPGKLPALNNFVNYLAGVAGGNQAGALLQFEVGSIQAVGSLTVAAGGSTNNDAGTIAGVTITAKTSSTANNEFTISATAATQAAAMIACINASTTLAGKVTASSGGGGIVTITAVQPGIEGNGLSLSAGTLTNVTASAFAGGTDGTAYSLDLR